MSGRYRVRGRRAIPVALLVRTAGLAVAFALGAAGCGAATSTSAPAQGPTPRVDGPTVILEDVSYEPQTLTVQAGRRVTWVWRDAPVQHDVSGDGFSSELQAEGTAGGRGIDLLRRLTPMLLRASLAITFTWFGALKVAGVPTLPGALVAAILPSWLDPAWAVPLLGGAEIALGLWLATGWRMSWAVGALTAHLSGTFLVLLVRPDVAFQGGNPLVLSVEGEFVVKNLALIPAILMLAARLPRAPTDRVPAARTREGASA